MIDEGASRPFMSGKCLEDVQSNLKSSGSLSNVSLSDFKAQPSNVQLETLDPLAPHKSMPNLPYNLRLLGKSTQLDPSKTLYSEIILAGDSGLAIIGKDESIMSSYLDHGDFLSVRVVDFNGM